MEQSLRETFMQLLRIGLWGEGQLRLTQPLSDADWQQIYQKARDQAVVGIIYASWEHLDASILPPRALRMRWTVHVEQIERFNRQMNKVLAEQYVFFTQAGLQPILQKGQGVAACYRQPLLRQSGDIDWYFVDQNFKPAAQLVERHGIDVRFAPGFSDIYEWGGVVIEHHKRLFDLRNPLIIPYLRNLEKTNRPQLQYLPFENVDVAVLKPELQLLQVTSHILKHLLLYGIGLRQLCDAAILYRYYVDRIDADTLKRIYQKSGMFRWVQVLHKILVEHFGLDQQALPFAYSAEEASEWMMDEVWYSGNFGFHDDRFKDASFTTLSQYPDGAKRILKSMQRYFKYVPLEVIVLPFDQLISKLFAKDEA